MDAMAQENIRVRERIAKTEIVVVIMGFEIWDLELRC